jgi:hypothetical protein
LVVLPEQFAATDVSAAGSVTNVPNAGTSTNTLPAVPKGDVKDTLPPVEAPAAVLGLPTNAVPE